MQSQILSSLSEMPLEEVIMTKTTTLERVNNTHITTQAKQSFSEAIRGIVSKVLTGKKADDFVTSW